MNKWRLKFGLKILFCVIFFGALLGFVVMSLWNWILPELFSVSKITFLQALGILALSKILFGGFKGWRKGCHGSCGCTTGTGEGHKGYWKRKWEEKLATMSPEEKEKFKESYKKCCGFNDNDSNHSK